MARAVAAVEAGRRNGVEVKKIQIHHLVLELGSIILSGSHNTWIGKYIGHLYHFYWRAGLKTAAAVGGGAYVGYQLGKFTGRLVFILFVCCLL